MKTVKGKDFVPKDETYIISEGKFLKRRTKYVRFKIKQYHRAVRRFFKKEIEREIK